MFNTNDNKSAKRIFEAVSIAALSCAAVELIKWAVKEVRDRVSPPKDDEEKNENQDDKDEEVRPAKKPKKKKK